MKKRIQFIVNPRSGVTKKHRIVDLIEQEIDTEYFDHGIVYTQYAGHATLLASNAAKEGYDIVAAVGGDGSVNEVAKGLIGTDTVLGMIPAGSGNGFAMHLGWGRNIRSVIRHLAYAEVERVDTCSVNGHQFVNLAGVGYEAAVAQQLRSVKKRGLQAYLRLSFSGMSKYKFKTYTINVDDKKLVTKALSITVANAPMYGYNFVVAPLAKYNDGQLEVIVFKKVPWIRYFISMRRFFDNTMHHSSIVHRLSGSKVEIELSEPEYAQYDGEGFLVENNKLVFDVNPLSLNVLVPNKEKKMEVLDLIFSKKQDNHIDTEITPLAAVKTTL
jgi:diacylglycerol kinase (ATP)